MTKLINSENFKENISEDSRPVLVDFYADWCSPCTNAAPIIEKLSEEFQNIQFCKLNIDQSQDIAAEYGVMSIPTFIVFEKGREKKRVIGLYSIDEFRSILKSF